MADLSLVILVHQHTSTIEIGFENFSTYDFVIEGELTFADEDPIPIQVHLPSQKTVSWRTLPLDYINEYPHFELSLLQQTTAGLLADFTQKIKPKPKHLLKASPLKAWQNHLGKTYLLWSDRQSKTEKIQLPPSHKVIRKNPNRPKAGIIKDLSQLAYFNRELDLHAEQLFESLVKVRPDEIYRKQLTTFSNYLDKAISLGIDRVFIIHGVGSGKLRRAIHQKLDHHPYVAKYDNAYHQKYGFGATEVWFT